MCTLNITYDKDNKQAREMLATLLASGLFYVNEIPEKKDRVYVEDDEVKWELAEDTTDLEDFRTFLHKMTDLEYACHEVYN